MHDTLATTMTSSRLINDPVVANLRRSISSLIEESFSIKVSVDGT